MSGTLQTVLDSIGYLLRPQQQRLYDALSPNNTDMRTSGVVAQAGTGTGKSLAVLCAAVDWARKTHKTSLVVCPTNVLLDQYLTVDAPRVSAATGVTIESLKGRNRYLCESANGFSDISQPPAWVMPEIPAMSDHLADMFNGGPAFEPENTQWFGCPGGEECDPELTCHYRQQKIRAQAADVIVTNSHLLIIDNQFKRMQAADPDFGRKKPPAMEQDDRDFEPDEYQQPEEELPILIFPPLGVVFVDEAHVLEDSLREFASRSIPSSACDGQLLGYWIDSQVNQLPTDRRGQKEATAITGDADLAAALQDMAAVPENTPKGIRLAKRVREAAESAAYVLQRAQNKAYSSGSAVLYLQPAERGTNQSNKLVSTQIDMSLAAAGILTSQPFGMVSATIPKSMRNALGVPEALFVDVGHPFDYSRQARLGFSAYTGAWKYADRANKQARAEEIQQRVLAAGGGALLLFPSYRDLEEVYKQIAGPLHLAGLTVLKQERESNKALLGERFKRDGNAVLFGTESFATGFDAPGSALRLVSIWKLPYPGLDPVTKAISARDYTRYQDMMLTKVAQAAGRLIRTSTDVGEVWISDVRARGTILGTGDPMLRHFDEFQLIPAAPRPADDIEMN